VTHGADTSFLVAVEIQEHARHAAAFSILEKLLAQKDRIGVTPQVLAEFIHIVTDARRFQQPISMELALEKSERWWNAAETDQVMPSSQAVSRLHDWMRRYQLGRKRVLDTLLAATFREAGITSLLTLDAADFAIFGEFVCVPLEVKAGPGATV
jgi:predicted nucleic acid-binding protein